MKARRRRRSGSGSAHGLARGQRRTAGNLIMAVMLLVLLLVFWQELATGAASCFGGVAGPQSEGVEVPSDDPGGARDETPRRRVQVKSVPRESL